MSSPIDLYRSIKRWLCGLVRLSRNRERGGIDLADITSGLPGVIYQFKIDADGEMSMPFISDAASKVFASDLSELQGDIKLIFSHIHPEDIEAFTHSVQVSRQNLTPWELEFRILTDAGEMWIRGSSLPHRQADGAILWNGMLVDISGERRAKEQLRESEARFQTIFRDLNIGMVTVNLDGTFREANRAFGKFVGRPLGELPGRSVFDVCHPQERELIEASMQSLIESNDTRPIHIEIRFLDNESSIKWGQVSATAFRDNQGKPRYLLAMVENINERKLIEKRVEESEALYRLLFESSTDGYLLLAHTVVDCNRQAAEMLGYSREELIGMNPYDFSPEFQPDGKSSEKAAKEIIRRTMRGRQQRFYWKHKRRDGTLIDTEIALKLITIHGEKLILAGLRDITEQLQQDREIKSSLVKVNTLIKSAIDGIIAFDEEGRIELLNPAASKIFECEFLESIGQDFFKLLAEPGASEFRERLLKRDKAELRHAGISDDSLTGVRFRSGSQFPLSLAVNPMQINDDLKFVAIVRDITDAKRAEQKIRENESKLKAILDSAAEGIIVIDETGCILNVNRAAERIFGRDMIKAHCTSVHSFIPSLDLAEVTANDPSDSYETQGVHRDRGEFPLQVSYSTVMLDSSMLITLIVRDKTFEIEQRDKMIESDKYISIGTLAAGIAHEFKNYLAGIVGHASFAKDLLEESGDFESAKEAFDQIVDIGEKANDVAMSLLSYSRKSNIEEELININELVRATVNFGRSELRGENVEFVDKLESTQAVRANSTQLQQVIFNLLLNARQAIPNGGALVIVTKDVDDHVELRVGDTGTGIEPADMKRIFDPFFSTKGVWGDGTMRGTGLGLYICKNILSRIGGEITVKSRIGVGTGFIVRIPAALDQKTSNRIPVDLHELVIATVDSTLVEKIQHEFSETRVDVSAVSDSDDFTNISATLKQESTLVVVDLNGLHPLDAQEIVTKLRECELRALILNDQNVDIPEHLEIGYYPQCRQRPPSLESLIATFATEIRPSTVTSRSN